MIAVYFNDEELRSLCLSLNVDYESLGGDGKKARAERLVSHMERHGRSEELLSTLNALRKHVAWPAL